MLEEDLAQLNNVCNIEGINEPRAHARAARVAGGSATRLAAHTQIRLKSKRRPRVAAAQTANNEAQKTMADRRCELHTFEARKVGT